MFNFIVKYVGGISYEIENEKNIINDRAIFTIRHESMWETLALFCLFKRPVFVMKKELRNIPIFGILAEKVHSIFVDREHGLKSLVDVSHKISDALERGSQVIIFPEGTRVPHGECVPLKRGIALFYKKNNCDVIPVMHDAGFFWPRHSFVKKSGTIKVKFMDAIPAGLDQDEFMNKLNHVFETEIKKIGKKICN